MCGLLVSLYLLPLASLRPQSHYQCFSGHCTCTGTQKPRRGTHTHTHIHTHTHTHTHTHSYWNAPASFLTPLSLSHSFVVFLCSMLTGRGNFQSSWEAGMLHGETGRGVNPGSREGQEGQEGPGFYFLFFYSAPHWIQLWPSIWCSKSSGAEDSTLLDMTERPIIWSVSFARTCFIFYFYVLACIMTQLLSVTI